MRQPGAGSEVGRAILPADWLSGQSSRRMAAFRRSLIGEPGRTRGIIFLEKSQGFPNHLTRGSVTARVDFGIDEAFRFGREGEFMTSP